MTFEKARKTASTMILVGIVISLFSMFTLPKGSIEYMLGGLVGILLLGGSIALCAVFCKCPHCGKDVLKAPKKSKSKQRSDYGNNNVGPRL